MEISKNLLARSSKFQGRHHKAPFRIYTSRERNNLNEPPE